MSKHMNYWPMVAVVLGLPLAWTLFNNSAKPTAQPSKPCSLPIKIGSEAFILRGHYGREKVTVINHYDCNEYSVKIAKSDVWRQDFYINVYKDNLVEIPKEVKQ